MELAAERPDDLGQTALDRHVDVLVGVEELELSRVELGRDRVEAALKLGQLAGVDHAGALEPGGMHPRALDVLRHRRWSKPIEALIRANRGSWGFSKRAMAG